MEIAGQKQLKIMVIATNVIEQLYARPLRNSENFFHHFLFRTVKNLFENDLIPQALWIQVARISFETDRRVPEVASSLWPKLITVQMATE